MTESISCTISCQLFIKKRGEPQSIVDHVRNLVRYILLVSESIFIEREFFKFVMRLQQNYCTRSFVNFSRFYSYNSILNHINSANSVLAAKRIKISYQFYTGVFLSFDCNRNSFFKSKSNLFGFVLCFNRIFSYLISIFGRWVSCILQFTALNSNSP